MPLTVGGGIRAFTDGTGKYHSALDVAAEYFRSGADKVSLSTPVWGQDPRAWDADSLHLHLALLVLGLLKLRQARPGHHAAPCAKCVSVKGGVKDPPCRGPAA